MSKDLEQYVADALRTEPDYAEALKRLKDPQTVRLLHVAMGLCTEAGEFMDALKRHIFYGKPLDEVNLVEELSDSSWYMRVGVAALETKFIEMLELNVAKLKQRFPDKFSEDAAINRDLDAERKVLEAR